jgi:multiple sugar transport system ATP-binding protein
MASVTYEQITKSFGEVEVIKGIDLDIRDGELVVFVGPSGCGKSTLLRMIAGLETPSSGNLFIGDTRVNDVPSKNRDIAMVFQNYALYPHMTVSENISFGLKLRGVDKAEREESAKQAAAILGIEDLLDRRPRALSGGQRQRVAMGRAIVRNPAVFLMDEPLSNLDAKLRSQMRVEIRKLQHRLQTTTIFVTHDQVEAMTLADRIAVLDGGYVQQFGTPSELYHKPVNKFVAGFLGSPSINFIRAKVVGEGELLLPDGQKVTVPAGRLQVGANVQEVDIGIRPEYIQVVENPGHAQAGSFSWQAEVSLTESLGSEVLVYVQLGGQDITIKIAEDRDIPEGSTVNLVFDTERAHLFSGADGALLSSGAG